MMPNIYELALLIPVVLIGIFWWKRSEQYTRALNFAREHCDERKLQLLDETLIFSQYQLKHGKTGHLYLLSVYSFDFSADGETRHSGEITLRGHQIRRILLAGPQMEICDF
jgi:hypothetical protein